MNQVASDTASIQAVISGEVKGQVAIGNNIVQIGSVHGGVVNIAMPGTIAPPKPRPTPVRLRPRPFPGLLDRRDETGRVAAALRIAQPIEIGGEPGLGKTSLLRYLAYYSFDTKYPDGVVHLSLRGQSGPDAQQALFEAFYESSQPFNVKPTEVQLRYALQDKQALILLDDVDMTPTELQAVMGTTPGCALVMTSTERRLWGEGSTLALAGLPLEDALILIERELGRPLTADERPVAEQLCSALQGHPLRLMQAAVTFREKRRTPALGVLPQTGAPAQALTHYLVASLSEPERQIAAALAALGDVSVSAEHLAGMTALSDVESIVAGLMQRALLRAEGGGYRLDVDLVQELQQLPDAQRWIEKALVYFLDWTEQHRDQFDRIVVEIDLLDRVLAYATQSRQWKEVLRLTVALEGALALGRRWGAWERVLRIGLAAARELRERSAEAWALHQLGTRALCLEHTSFARDSLVQALRLRESIGDQQGARVTRHNLNILLGPPAPPQEPPRQLPGPASPARGLLLLSKILLSVAVVALILFNMFEAIHSLQAQTSTPSPMDPATATPTQTSTSRFTDTPTATSTSTSTPTPTPTDAATSTSTPVPSAVPCIPRYGWPVYFVQYGDTLSLIALRTRSTLYELKWANCLINDYLYAGQPLFVPRLPVLSTATLRPAPTDTATPTLTSSPIPCVPQYQWPIYVVQPGDTLSSIASRIHSTPDELKQANCLTSDYIDAGQKLFVPRLPPTATFVITPTFTPSPPPEPAPAVIKFWADAYDIELGRCTILHWTLENVRAAYLTGGEFGSRLITDFFGAQDACPKTTTSYTLQAVLFDKGQEVRSVTINVVSPATPTLAPTPIPTLVPTLTSPPPTLVLN